MDEFTNAFNEWMITINGITSKTAYNYISTLKNIHTNIQELDSNKNYFEYSIDEMPIVSNKIRTSSRFNELDKKWHQGLSCALNKVDKYLEYLTLSAQTYFNIKISDSKSLKIVNDIESGKSNIEISNLSQLDDKIAIGQLVFVTCVGDKVSWEKGLKGIARVSKLPYNRSNRLYSIQIDMICAFNTITRQDFIPYPGTYDAADIGPSTKGSQNQAIKCISFAQVTSLIRAIAELRPECIETLQSVIETDIIKNAFGIQRVFYEKFEPLIVKNNLSGYNKIFYGIPGCGKSYTVENEVLDGVNKDDIFRTTFYLDYSNTDFIGQIYPVTENGEVKYKNVPGPFTKALARALRNPSRMIYLVIEEINRGNAAAIFGDVFQLLDRLKDDKDDHYKGESEYPITNEFIEGYLKEMGIPFVEGQICIPSNLTILATMNTSDQNVFPLDTAFKRRWKMKKIAPDVQGSLYADYYVPSEIDQLTWGEFLKLVNDYILSDNEGYNLEDKQIGPYFVVDDILVESFENVDDLEERFDQFIEKVLNYIWVDVAKFNQKKRWITSGVAVPNSFDKLADLVKEKGLKAVLAPFKKEG